MYRSLCLLIGAWTLVACSPTDLAKSSVSQGTLFAQGKDLYAKNCASCHMEDGSGVPNMQPALAGDAVACGEPTILIRVLLKGPEKVLPSNRESYSNAMPAFARLSDQEVASVLTYIRASFDNKASMITPEKVAAIRLNEPH